ETRALHSDSRGIALAMRNQVQLKLKSPRDLESPSTVVVPYHLADTTVGIPCGDSSKGGSPTDKIRFKQEDQKILGTRFLETWQDQQGR
ncbi:hypothetical protein Bhyg_12178, partial [Pseudolycoriella hygida]